jgi:hypothetical protein
VLVPLQRSFTGSFLEPHSATGYRDIRETVRYIASLELTLSDPGGGVEQTAPNWLRSIVQKLSHFHGCVGDQREGNSKVRAIPI